MEVKASPLEMMELDMAMQSALEEVRMLSSFIFLSLSYFVIFISLLSMFFCLRFVCVEFCHLFFFSNQKNVFDFDSLRSHFQSNMMEMLGDFQTSWSLLVCFLPYICDIFHDFSDIFVHSAVCHRAGDARLHDAKRRGKGFPFLSLFSHLLSSSLILSFSFEYLFSFPLSLLLFFFLHNSPSLSPTLPSSPHLLSLSLL